MPNTTEAQATRLAELVRDVAGHRGAMDDMRDFCEELGYVTAQRARETAVVRIVEQRYPGGVAAFLSNY